MRRVKLSFAAGVEVEFTDRDRAIQQVEVFAERGTRFPIVVFGPRGAARRLGSSRRLRCLGNTATRRSTWTRCTRSS